MDVQAQVQAIMDKLRGAPAERLPESGELEEPLRTIYGRVRRCENEVEAAMLIVKATLDLDEGRRLAKVLLRMLPTDEEFLGYASLQEMSERFPEVDWLWPLWVPRGMLTLLGAEPGVGKSMVALDLARRVIHGDPFPDGTPSRDEAQDGGTRKNVLLVDAEGTPALLRQRAEAWGIDDERLFLMLGPTGGGLLDLAEARQQRRLLRMCARLEPALVVIDSLAAATKGSESSLEGTRAILGFLAHVARRGGVAVLVIHHLRKRARTVRRATRGRVAVDDLRGSSHISAAARSVMALSVVEGPGQPRVSVVVLEEQDRLDRDAPAGQGSDIGGGSQIRGRSTGAPLTAPRSVRGRRLEIVKTNLCRPPRPLLLTLEGERAAVPTLRYSEWVDPPPEPSEMDLCARWMVEYLRTLGEEVRPAVVVRAAAEEGFSRTTVYRARRSLGELVVDVGKNTRDPRKRWALGGGQ